MRDDERDARYHEAVIIPFRRGRAPERAVTRPGPFAAVDDRWTRDVDRLRDLDRSLVARRARAAVSRDRRPEHAAEPLARYAAHLLGVGAGLTYVELLHVAYWIDRLTVVLVRAQRWGDALAWLDRLAELPPRYTSEVTMPMRARLARRRLRCRRRLGRRPGEDEREAQRPAGGSGTTARFPGEGVEQLGERDP